MRLVGAHRDGDAQPVVEGRGQLQLHRHVPAADEKRQHRRHLQVQTGGQPPLQAAQARLGRSHRLLAREQQRDVDRHAVEDDLLDRLQALRCARDLDEQVGLGSLLAQPVRCLDGVGGVVGQQRRDLERDPAVHALAGVEGRAEQVGRLAQVFEGEFEEQVLVRQVGIGEHANAGVVAAALADGVLEDRRVRGQPGHRQVADVARQRAAGQQRARDVVEPEALAEPVQCLCRVHAVHLGVIWVGGCAGRRRHRGQAARHGRRIHAASPTAGGSRNRLRRASRSGRRAPH